MTDFGKVAYVFPGQGSQTVGMGRDLYDAYPCARAIFNQADEVLGIPLSRMCFEGPEEELRLTINAQPALVTASFACLKVSAEVHGPKLPAASFLAGHSLGEYTALAAAGVIDFSTAVHLARERGRLMHEAGLKRQGAMAAVIGLDEGKLAEVCQKSGTYIANFNSPGQLVISGEVSNVYKAAELAKLAGAARTIPLPVSGAFHTPLMQPAAEGLARVIGGITFNEPAVPVVGNVTAEPLTGSSQIKEELVRQLTSAVQWQRSVEYMIGAGVHTFFEIGPGRVLAGLIKRIDRSINTVNLSDANTVKNLLT